MSGDGSGFRRQTDDADALYRSRPMAEGHPVLASAHLEWYVSNLEKLPDESARNIRMMTYLGRVVDLSPPKDLLIVGCGPRPTLIKELRESGHRVTGVEPLPTYLGAARDYLGGADDILQGSAEALPAADTSYDLVLCESVLEHVDSPRLALDQMHRVLRPGRIAFVTTTNRLRFSLVGNAGEFNVRFFNWFPRLVRESYAFRHLHYDPTLANYTLRPAVHWFTFSRLCELGRESGFAQFYSPLDLFEGGGSDHCGKVVEAPLAPASTAESLAPGVSPLSGRTRDCDAQARSILKC